MFAGIELFTCASINKQVKTPLHVQQNVYEYRERKKKYICRNNARSCHTSMTSEHALIAIYFDKLIIFDVHPSAACSLRKDLINRHRFFLLPFFSLLFLHLLFVVVLILIFLNQPTIPQPYIKL